MACCFRRGLLVIAMLAALGWAQPAAQAAETAQEIRDCMRGNAPERTSEQTIKFVSHDRVGAVTESRAKIYRKKYEDGLSRALVRMLAPLDMRGTGLLILENADRDDDLFVFMPDVGKVRRLNKRAQSSSLFGTDFSYEQFEQLQGFYEDSVLSRMPDTEVKEHGAYVLESKPKDPETARSGDARSVWYIDKKTCAVLKAEFYEVGDRLRRVLEVDPKQIEQAANHYVPRWLMIHDVRDDTRTELVVEKIELDKEIPDRRFTKSALMRSR